MRTLKNTLTEAELLEDIASRSGDTDAVLARYGADLLGRAIGHEHQADPIDLGGWADIIRDIRLARVFTPAQQIMIHTAITEVTLHG